MRKIINGFISILFAAMIVIPVACVNHRPNQISEIDNRELQEWPIRNPEYSGGIKAGIENYFQDRIGFRTEMINAYTKLNDKVFGKMVHPTYTYGEDGYVFFNVPAIPEHMTDWMKAFADMTYEIQEYCVSQDVPFIFVLNPAKLTVLSDYMPKGTKYTQYNKQLMNEFEKYLNEKGVNYVNNTQLLVDKTVEGEVVFNKMYNAGHWNDLGAYYGVNHIIQKLNEYYPELDLIENDANDFEINMEHRDSLQVSEFKIDDAEPVFTVKKDYNNIKDKYKDIKLDEQYRQFNYFVVNNKEDVNNYRLLCFQGSYMNGMEISP